MEKKTIIISFSILFIVVSTVQAQILGRVIKISDGDTFTLLTPSNTAFKIRLHGIDCPEKNQPYGQKAKQYLSNKIYGRNIKVIVKGRDRYRRNIGIAFYQNLNINEAILQDGFAWHYKKYDNNPTWALLERKARVNKRGLWADKNALAPWVWRSNKRK